MTEPRDAVDGREAAEIAMAQAIWEFYGGRPAPLPEGVIPATEAELAVVDTGGDRPGHAAQVVARGRGRQGDWLSWATDDEPRR